MNLNKVLGHAELMNISRDFWPSKGCAMIPLKDMRFKVQMCLSPEEEEKMKRSILELYSRRTGENPAEPRPGFGYSVEIMSIPEAFEWFQALKHAYDLEQAAASTVTK
jgi:hypothetical protein